MESQRYISPPLVYTSPSRRFFLSLSCAKCSGFSSPCAKGSLPVGHFQGKGICASAFGRLCLSVLSWGLLPSPGERPYDWTRAPAADGQSTSETALAMESRRIVRDDTPSGFRAISAHTCRRRSAKNTCASSARQMPTARRSSGRSSTSTRPSRRLRPATLSPSPSPSTSCSRWVGP